MGSSSQIALANNMPNLNTSNTTQNAITILQTGIYEINYYCNMSLSVATSATLSIRQNGTVIPSTSLTRNVGISSNAMLINSVIVSLSQNDVIDMVLSAGLAASATLGSGVNASLSVKKIN